MDSPWPQIFGGCFAVAALFYGWLKYINWRDAKRWKKMKLEADWILAGCDDPLARAATNYPAWWKKFRDKGILLALLLPLAGCSTTKNADGSTTTTLDPELKTEGKSFVLAVLRAGEVRALEKITGRSVETVTTPVKVTAQK
jgi:hypothetical protein